MEVPSDELPVVPNTRQLMLPINLDEWLSALKTYENLGITLNQASVHLSNLKCTDINQLLAYPHLQGFMGSLDPSLGMLPGFAGMNNGHLRHGVSGRQMGLSNFNVPGVINIEDENDYQAYGGDLYTSTNKDAPGSKPSLLRKGTSNSTNPSFGMQVGH